MGYTGARVSIPIGQVGFTNIQNMSKTPIEGAIQAEGLEFIEGSVQREPGNRQFVDFPIDTMILQAIEFTATLNTKRLLAYVKSATSTAAAIYKSTDGAPAVAIKTGLTELGQGFKLLAGGAESAGRANKMFLFNGNDLPQVVSGDSAIVTNLSKPAADWTGINQPLFGTMHRNCVWAGGNKNDPHRIYKSLAADHEDYTTTAFSISVFPGEGETLIGGYSLSGRLFLFKHPRGIYWVDDTSTNQADWGVKKLVDTIGLANPNALCQTETDLVFLDPSPALFALGAVQEFGDVRPRSLLEEFGVDRWLKDNMKKDDHAWEIKTVPKAIWHPDKRTVILTFVKSPGVYGKLFLDYRYSPVKVGYSFRDPWLASAVFEDTDTSSKHVYGASDWLYMGDQESRSVASLSNGPWVSKYQIPHTNLTWSDASLVGERIGLEWLTIESTIFTQQTIFVDVFLDGVYKYTLDYVFPVTLEGFILDSDALDEGVLGGPVTFTRTKRLRGTCERFSFLFYSNHPTANFILNDVLLSYRRHSARMRQKP